MGLLIKISTIFALMTAIIVGYAKIKMPPAVWDAHILLLRPTFETSLKNAFSFLGGPLNPQPTSSPPSSTYDLCPSSLSAYDGSSYPSSPILLSVGGLIIDVSSGSKFYGLNQPYNLFAGKACTRALALGSLDPKDLNDDLDGVPRKSVEGQVKFYKEKYKVVGRLKSFEECN
ncbi:hypothetical protein TrST_g5435 [Triparma strigata]|uniref:Cytochrome b5 heme-binding domain-containing protein n=1 Tax=Triparma strigata TaxID=1606541 RepID=A0A9W7AD38_9STRA|nr:hypothetical protein TrST_g5435 [Triparma strigata]